MELELEPGGAEYLAVRVVTIKGRETDGHETRGLYDRGQ